MNTTQTKIGSYTIYINESTITGGWTFVAALDKDGKCVIQRSFPAGERYKIPAFVQELKERLAVWYRQVNPTSWIAYQGNAAIWEASTVRQLLDKLREMGIKYARHEPLRVVKII